MICFLFIRQNESDGNCDCTVSNEMFFNTRYELSVIHKTLSRLSTSDVVMYAISLVSMSALPLSVLNWSVRVSCVVDFFLLSAFLIAVSKRSLVTGFPTKSVASKSKASAAYCLYAVAKMISLYYSNRAT